MSKRLALFAVNGVGDASLGQWSNEETKGIWHVRRRLTDEERAQFDVPAPIDIRGTPEEHRRLRALFVEAPHLMGRLL